MKIASAQYAEELKLLLEQFSNRFSDFKNMEDSIYFLLQQKVMYKMLQYLQMELIEIQENSLLKSKFEDVRSCAISTKNVSKTIFRSLENSQKDGFVRLAVLINVK